MAQSFRRDGAYWLRKVKAKKLGLLPAARGRQEAELFCLDFAQPVRAVTTKRLRHSLGAASSYRNECTEVLSDLLARCNVP